MINHLFVFATSSFIKKHQFLKGNAAVKTKILDMKRLTHNQKNWNLWDGMHLEYTYDSLWKKTTYYLNTTAQINQTSNS